jgi:site-specific DNA recombinase
VPRELWDRVAAQLRSDNQGHRNGVRAASPSLLAGLLQDGQGNRFTPSHAVKRGRRYRYYVARFTKGDLLDRATGPTARLPAGEIEGVVLATLRSALQSDHEIMDRLGFASDTPAFTQQLIASARKWSHEWNSVAPAKVHRLVRAAIKRVIVQERRVELYVSKSELRKVLAEGPTSSWSQVPGDDLFVLETEAKLKRCGGEVRLVVPPKSDGKIVGKSAPALLRAVARAHDWRERMVDGSLLNGPSIAGSSGLNQRYVRRVLQCAFLAPDIVEAILDGRHPPNLTVRKLWRDLPADWCAQRKRLGFPSTRVS